MAKLKLVERLGEILSKNPEWQNARFLFALGRITTHNTAARPQPLRMVVGGVKLSRLSL